MTAYELATSVPKERRLQMAEAGIYSKSIERYIYIYEMYVRLIDEGKPKMEAYMEISMRCYTSDENVRKIIKMMSREVE